MIELSDADFQYDSEDMVGLAVAQGISLVVAAVAVCILGSHYVGIADSYGVSLTFPYSGVLGPALAVAALATAAAIPARFSRVWNSKRGRKRIVAGLGQMAITALVVLAAGLVLAGGRLDVLTPGQLMQSWLYCGLLVAGVGHLVIVAATFARLVLRRELPDFVD